MIKEYSQAEFEADFKENALKLKPKFDNIAKIKAALASIFNIQQYIFYTNHKDILSNFSVNSDEQGSLYDSNLRIQDVYKSNISLVNTLEKCFLERLNCFALDFLVKRISEGKYIDILNGYYLKESCSPIKRGFTQDEWMKIIISELNVDEPSYSFREPFFGITSHILDKTIDNIDELKLKMLPSYVNNILVKDAYEQNEFAIKKYIAAYSSYMSKQAENILLHDDDVFPFTPICDEPHIEQFVDYYNHKEILQDYSKTLIEF